MLLTQKNLSEPRVITTKFVNQKLGKNEPCSRCHCCQDTVGNLPDTIMVYAAQADLPLAQFEVLNVAPGKVALKADNGEYVVRCKNYLMAGLMRILLLFRVRTPLYLPPYNVLIIVTL